MCKPSGLSKLFFRTGNLKKANEYAVEAVQLQQEFKSWWNQLDATKYINEGKENFQQGLFDEATGPVTNHQLLIRVFPGLNFSRMVRNDRRILKVQQRILSNALKIYPNHEKTKGLDMMTLNNYSMKRINLTKVAIFQIVRQKQLCMIRNFIITIIN